MKYFFIPLLLLLCFVNCSESVKDTSDIAQTYGNSTDKIKYSSDKIDGSPTYEVHFTLEKPADCISIDIESVFLQKTFPLQKIPKKTYFILEKKIRLPNRKTTDKSYTPLGRNFNNDWEIFSPVKICTNKNDPLSAIDASEYRIRFTVFEKSQLYFFVTMQCDSKIIFSDYTPGK
jgi:hypothetical protein